MNGFNKLIEIVKTLRGDNGCPWDQKQTLHSMKKQILEEIYEMFDAIELSDENELKEEVGDLFMHLVFITDIASDKNWFELEDVFKSICTKLINRHPHVFGSVNVAGEAEVLRNWELIKKQEKKERKYLLDGIPKALPSILRSLKIQNKLKRVGFEWPNVDGVLDKIKEEIDELKVEIDDNNKKLIEEEMGDVFFALINLSIKLEVDPESALQKANNKVIKRFNFVEEKLLSEDLKIEDVSLNELDKYWDEAKFDDI